MEPLLRVNYTLANACQDVCVFEGNNSDALVSQKACSSQAWAASSSCMIVPTWSLLRLL